MAETFVEYAQRLRGYVGSKDPLQSMQETSTTLTALVEGAPQEIVSTRPGPGKWSVSEIVAHLADAELVSGFRFRFIVGADDGVTVPAYDQDRWAQAANYRAIPLEASLKSFLALREMNLRFLKSLSEQSWNKFGMHSERGRERLRDLVQLVAGHDLNHLGQIRKILGGAQAA
ncbi:MAG TPA: DinB family protein [Candidatus Angelobacter sp.]